MYRHTHVSPTNATDVAEQLAGMVYEVLAPSFKVLIDPVSRMERLYTGCQWAEGPVYFADHRCLLWSDIPSQRILRYDEVSGHVSLFRANSGYANGNTRDRDGRLVTCEQGRRRVTRTELDGKITTLADRYLGAKLNSPNDVVVRSDGTIWFTDPSYGVISDYVGNREEREISSCNVYRLNPQTGRLDVVADDFSMPNGLAFSPDERLLYIADSGYLPDETKPRHIRVFTVGDAGGLSGGEILTEIFPGIPDGLRVDEIGNLWISAGDGVHCVTARGELIGKLLVPEAVANLTFGGPKMNRLFMTATTSLYALHLNISGT